MGLKARIKITVPGLNENNKIKRIEWAEKYQNKTFYWWRTVFFSDESKLFS